jgi:hypothetical protein
MTLRGRTAPARQPSSTSDKLHLQEKYAFPQRIKALYHLESESLKALPRSMTSLPPRDDILQPSIPAMPAQQ